MNPIIALSDTLAARGIVVAPSVANAAAWISTNPSLVATASTDWNVSPNAWLQARVTDGRTGVAVFGVLDRGLRGNTLRFYLATSALLLACEKVLPDIGDDQAARLASANAMLALAGRCLALANRSASRSRLLVLESDRDGNGIATTESWLETGGVTATEFAWVEALAYFEAKTV
jgi:hypothetical protein